MEYEKEKINRLIDYKDKLINEKEKSDLEWILEQYNEYYVNKKEYIYRQKKYNEITKKYYDSEDEKERIKKELIVLKKKYKKLLEIYNSFLYQI